MFHAQVFGLTRLESAQAAMMITNTGGRDVVISQIQVRGIAATISHTGNVYFEINAAGTVPNELISTGNYCWHGHIHWRHKQLSVTRCWQHIVNTNFR